MAGFFSFGPKNFLDALTRRVVNGTAFCLARYLAMYVAVSLFLADRMSTIGEPAN